MLFSMQQISAQKNDSISNDNVVPPALPKTNDVPKDTVYTDNSSRLLTTNGVYIVNYIAANFNYPDDALGDEIQGTVVAEFIVEKDGSVSDIKIVKSLCTICDAEVVRVIKSTTYKVTNINDEPQRVLYRIPVKLQLE